MAPHSSVVACSCSLPVAGSSSRCGGRKRRGRKATERGGFARAEQHARPTAQQQQQCGARGRSSKRSRRLVVMVVAS